MTNSSPLIEYLVAAERIVIFTGAGISTGAGIPDYRGPGGVWKTRPEIMLHDFFEDPAKREQYWQFKSGDWERWGHAEPTSAHQAIVRLEQLGKLRTVITQNIDGLHRKAGTPEARLVELHGRADQVLCVDCGFREAGDPWYRGWLDERKTPVCPHCGQFLKPGVVQFGETLREEDLMRAQEAMRDPDLVIAIGSTLAVHPAASFPIMAARAGIPYLIINQGKTAHDGLPHVALRLEGDAQEIFPAAVDDAAAMFG